MNKICVYAICKNELNNLTKWLDSVLKADLIVLIDTGSTDGTFEKLKKLEYNNLFIEQFIQEEFDFSVARNYALKKAFELTTEDWIYLSLDLDEFLEEEGFENIKNNWNSQYDTMKLKGVTSENDFQYVEYKLHSGNREWFWHRPIHEIIKLPNKKQKEWVVGPAVAAYQHCQDLEKPRNYYDKLLKAYQKNPNDIKTVIYLSWETLLNEGLNENYFKYNLECINLILNNEEDEYYMDYEYLIQCHINLSNYHLECGNWSAALGYLLSALSFVENGKFPKIRRIYFLLANLYWEHIDKEQAIELYHKCLTVREMPYCWVDEAYLYDDSIIFTSLANAYYYTDNFYLAYEYAKKAYNIDKSWLNFNNLSIIKRRYKDEEK